MGKVIPSRRGFPAANAIRDLYCLVTLSVLKSCMKPRHQATDSLILLGAIHIRNPQNVRDFLTPPLVTVMITQPIICSGANSPPPPSVQTSYIHVPLSYARARSHELIVHLDTSVRLSVDRPSTPRCPQPRLSVGEQASEKWRGRSVRIEICTTHTLCSWLW